jgi:putative chitinase
MTRADLLRIMPLSSANADAFAVPLGAAMVEFGIDTPRRQAAFLAQVGHESDQLSALEENMNYRPQAILDTFNSATHVRFTPEQAELYGRTPERPANRQMIANIAYANRGGNGDAASGDGWTFRGAGLIQLTLRNAHEACADHFGVPRSDIGKWLRTPEGASRSAARYWKENGLNELADSGDFVRITVRINGGLKGQAQRLALWDSARQVMGAA